MTANVEGVEREIMLHHCRLGHPSFDSLIKLYPDIFKKVVRSRLVCDACELDKHTRSTYPSIGLHSYEPFILIHSDAWCLCSVTSMSGSKCSVTKTGLKSLFRCIKIFKTEHPMNNPEMTLWRNCGSSMVNIVVYDSYFSLCVYIEFEVCLWN
jgi:hypothetical protein